MEEATQRRRLPSRKASTHVSVRRVGVLDTRLRHAQ